MTDRSLPSSSVLSAVPASRDRLLFFRQLFLVFALFALFAIAALQGLNAIGAGGQATLAVACAMLLGLSWAVGYRQRWFSRLQLPLESVLLVGFTMGVQDPVASLGVHFIGVQYRALYGDRRDAWLLPFGYGFAFVIGVALSPVGLDGISTVVLVDIMALGFSSYVLHTLKEVLERDRDRENALRNSEQRFRAVADNLREALLMTDMSDTIVLANARVRDVFGYEPKELVGKKATDLLLPEARDEWGERMRRRLSGESEVYETELVRKDGSRIFVEISASPNRDASGKITGSLGAISDISERKRLEERLHQGMRMEAVGQLAGGVAHDFNNLLTVIKCNTELLLGDMSPLDPARASVSEIDKSANRGAALTQQLLAFGRKQLLQPRQITLADVVASSATVLRKLTGHDVMLVTVHDDSKQRVFADPLQLEHVLVTLVRNAGEAMPNGGRITIETRAVTLTDEHSAETTQETPSGHYAMLSVADTGVGMPREVMARLFEPFVTTKAVGEGTGLGLASMYGVVRQSGGYVEIDSTPNIGTTVRIYLPLAEEPRLQMASPELMTA